MNLTHHFLVSMPQLQEGCFKDSLVYILEHSPNGAFGVIVNQEIGMSLREVFTQLAITTSDDSLENSAILLGGPVNESHGMVLHKSGCKFDITQDFKGGVSISSSRDVLESIAQHKEPVDYLVVLGHAGWAAGQLEMEVAENAWLTVEASASILFNTPTKDRRQSAGSLIGIDLNTLVGHSGNA